MPREPKPRWHAGNQQWVSDVGDQYVDAKGRTRRRTVPFPGIGRKEEKKAREALQAYQDERAERVRDADDPTVKEIVELYLEWVDANRETTTYTTAESTLRRFAEFAPPGSRVNLARMRVSQMDVAYLEKLLDQMARKGRKPSYRSLLNSTVQACFNWAAKRLPERKPPVLIPANPFRGVASPTIPRSPERYAERDELAAFLRWAWRRAPRTDERGRKSLTAQFDRHLCLLIRVAAHTGSRPGELCIAGVKLRDYGFTWDTWNPKAAVNSLGQDVGVITHAKHKTSRKIGRAREIVVPPILARAIERHRARAWAHPKWVFTHRRSRGWEERGDTTAAVGEPWKSQYLCLKIRNWRRMAIAEGKRLKAEGKPTRGLELIQDEGDNRFVLYRLRHTRITDLIGANGGLSYDQAAALTGTSGKMIETTYGHLTGARLIELDQAARARRK